MATTTTSFSGHIVAIAAAGWGHSKPLAALASKVVQERSDILITLVVSDNSTTMRMEKEISRYFPETFGERPRSNIRVISMGGEGSTPMDRRSLMVKGFGPIYTKLANLEPVLCSTGKSYDTPLTPSLAIVDFFFPDIILYIRKANKNNSHITILAWNTSNAGALLRLVGPEKYGGQYGDVATKARELAAATGRDLAEIENELFHPANGTVINIPGAPPMFDYEFSPQEPQKVFLDFQRIVYKDSYRFVPLCDGMITTTSAIFEPEAHEAMRKWLGETNRPHYVLGPLEPQGLQSGALADSTKENDLSAQKGRELLEFLDTTLQTNGANSLIYISWGSVWWPKEEYVWKLIDVLLELKFPFILAHASPMATIDAEVSAKVKASGIGWLSSWAPQQFILAHPVTGWFLTHCGQNSVTEATSQGVPMIAWPVSADQPLNAARLSVSLDVAFELIEVRVGHSGLKPLYRGVTPKGTIDAVESEFREVLKDAKGPVGNRKRQNVQRLRDAMKGAWGDEGDAVKALRELLNDHFP